MLCLSNDKMMNSMRLKLNSFWWSPVKSKHYICFTYLFMVILCLTFPLIFNWQSTDDVTQKMGSSCLYMMILYLTGGQDVFLLQDATLFDQDERALRNNNFRFQDENKTILSIPTSLKEK